jgi:hypothetical protein
MENSKILAEAILNNWYDQYESGNSGRTFYTCHYCGGYGVPSITEIEHDSECPVLVAQRVLEEV